MSLVDDGPTFTDRFEKIEASLDDLGRAVGFLLAAATKMPAQMKTDDLRALLDRLKVEQMGTVVPASGIIV
jgi:hypothetical protein